MIKNLRKVSLSMLVVGIIFISIISISIPSRLSSTDIHLSSNDSFSFSGDYEGDISIMYIHQTTDFKTWFDANSSTSLISHNNSDYPNYEFKLNRLDIFADHLINDSGSGEYIIANNISRIINLEPAIIFSQEFISHDLVSLKEITLYLNYSLAFLPVAGHYYFVLIIFDENFETQIDIMLQYEWNLALDKWVSFFPRSNIFEPGSKNITSSLAYGPNMEILIFLWIFGKQKIMKHWVLIKDVR